MRKHTISRINREGEFNLHFIETRVLSRAKGYLYLHETWRDNSRRGHCLKGRKSDSF